MRIYVGNLSYDTGDGELNTAFATYGEVVSAQVVTDRGTGQSRGFGFVEMTNDSDAQGAITALNGSQLQGRTLTVNEARPRAEAARAAAVVVEAAAVVVEAAAAGKRSRPGFLTWSK